MVSNKIVALELCMYSDNSQESLWKILGVTVLAFCLIPAGRAASYTTIHSFPANSGPSCALVQDHEGTLYGTTQRGGDSGYGSVFRISNTGVFTNLLSFTYSDGAYPCTGLLLASDGVLYGTAANGSTNYYGSVFRVTTNGLMTTLAAFTFSNGAYPKGTLLEGADGALYGTTYGGGTNGVGTVFRITTNGEMTSLVSFAVTNGARPTAGLTLGSDGALYGTTSQGGLDPTNFLVDYGSVFRITTNGELTTLAMFNGYGVAFPCGGLMLGNDGLLYGTTSGTVFSITTNGILDNFASLDFYNSGIDPDGALIQCFDGAFYGTTSQGGGGYGGGTLFRVTTNGLVSPIIPLPQPMAGLLRGMDGALYGTTSQGGLYGGGTVFRVDLASSIFVYPLVQETNGYSINFNGLPGDSYQVLRATNLAGPWLTITNVTAGQFGDGHCIDSSSPLQNAFYRLAFP